MSGIENTISEKLQDASWVQVDEAALWNGIEAQMAPSGKRGIFWIFGASGLVLAALITLLSWQDGTMAGKLQFHNPELFDHSARPVVSLMAVTESNVSADSSLQESSTPKHNVEEGRTQTNSAKPQPQEMQISEVDVSHEATADKTTVSNANSSIGEKNSSITGTGSDASEQAIPEARTSSIVLTGKAKEESANMSTDLTSGRTTTLTFMLRRPAHVPSQMATANLLGFKHLTGFTELPPTGSLIHFDVFAGPNRSSISYSSGDSHLEDLKNSTEDGEWGMSIGLMARREMSKGLFVGAGVEHSKIWTQFEYRNESTSTGVTENHPIQITIDGSSGDTLEVIYGDSPTTFYHTRHVRHYAEFNVISIPVVVGKRIEKDKFGLGIAAGPVFNMSYKQAGRAISSGEELFTFEDENDSAPINGFGIGARFQAQAEYNINDQWSAHFTPAYSISWKKVSDDLNARLSWLTLGAGIGFEF